MVGNMKTPYKNIVVLTGAGISAESGVAVFRGPDGLWEGRKVEEVATSDAVEYDRWGVNAFFNGLRAKLYDVHPNAAHHALAAFEAAFDGDFLLVTQNIDDLHDRAGSKNLIHMHGELLRLSCDACGGSFVYREALEKHMPCQLCGKAGLLRPDITLFGEMPKQIEIIVEALSQCDLFIAVGTSGFVYPAAGFVDIANRAHAHTVEINLAETSRSDAFAEHLVGPAGERVPDYLALLLAAVD